MNPFELTPRERSDLRELVRGTEEARILRRAQALLWLNQGESPSDVAERLYVSRQTVYNWAYRFQDRYHLDVEERLADGARSGRPPSAQGLIDGLLLDIIDDDPRDWGYHATVWTAPLMQKYLKDAYAISVSRPSVSAALDRLALRWKRPRHQLARRPETWRQSKGGSNAA